MMKVFFVFIYAMIGLGAAVGTPARLCGKPLEWPVKASIFVMWPITIGARLANSHGAEGVSYDAICAPGEAG